MSFVLPPRKLQLRMHLRSLALIQTTVVMVGTSLAVQWLRLHASPAGGTGSIPGQETKIRQAAWCGQKQTNKPKNSNHGDDQSLFFYLFQNTAVRSIFIATM